MLCFGWVPRTPPTFSFAHIVVVIILWSFPFCGQLQLGFNLYFFVVVRSYFIVFQPANNNNAPVAFAFDASPSPPPVTMPPCTRTPDYRPPMDCYPPYHARVFEFEPRTENSIFVWGCSGCVCECVSVSVSVYLCVCVEMQNRVYPLELLMGILYFI